MWPLSTLYTVLDRALLNPTCVYFIKAFVQPGMPAGCYCAFDFLF